MGECFFMSGYTPGELAQFGGEGCFAGAGPYTQRGGGLFAKMMTEGFRWHGIAGWQFCVSGGQVGQHALQLAEARGPLLPPVELDLGRGQHSPADAEALQRHPLQPTPSRRPGN